MLLGKEVKEKEFLYYWDRPGFNSFNYYETIFPEEAKNFYNKIYGFLRYPGDGGLYIDVLRWFSVFDHYELILDNYGILVLFTGLKKIIVEVLTRVTKSNSFIAFIKDDRFWGIRINQNRKIENKKKIDSKQIMDMIELYTPFGDKNYGGIYDHLKYIRKKYDIKKNLIDEIYYLHIYLITKGEKKKEDYINTREIKKYDTTIKEELKKQDKFINRDMEEQKIREEKQDPQQEEKQDPQQEEKQAKRERMAKARAMRKTRSKTTEKKNDQEYKITLAPVFPLQNRIIEKKRDEDKEYKIPIAPNFPLQNDEDEEYKIPIAPFSAFKKLKPEIQSFRNNQNVEIYENFLYNTESKKRFQKEPERSYNKVKIRGDNLLEKSSRIYSDLLENQRKTLYDYLK
jgi:hypothetical protein